MSEWTLQEQTVLNLLEKHLDYTNNAIDGLDSKAQENINISSIIIAILGAFTLSGTTSTLFDSTNLICIFLVYCFVFLISFWARRPQRVKNHPMMPNYENAKKWAEMDAEAMFNLLVSSYAEIIENNSAIVDRKAPLVKLGTLFICIDLILVFAAVLIV